MLKTPLMKHLIRLLMTLALITSSRAFAAKLFVSNNTNSISPVQAFKRLHDKVQSSLIFTAITSLQEGHYQQGRISSSLGNYVGSDDRVTADNTLVFTTSPLEKRSKVQISEIAQKMANTFHQESVAVFLSNKNAEDVDTTIYFKKRAISYADFQEKIPLLKSVGLDAYTLYLNGNSSAKLEERQIVKIEFLSSKTKEAILSRIFSGNTVVSTPGDAFLVFEDGHTSMITQ